MSVDTPNYSKMSVDTQKYSEMSVEDDSFVYNKPKTTREERLNRYTKIREKELEEEQKKIIENQETKRLEKVEKRKIFIKNKIIKNLEKLNVKDIDHWLKFSTEYVLKNKDILDYMNGKNNKYKNNEIVDIIMNEINKKL